MKITLLLSQIKFNLRRGYHRQIFLMWEFESKKRNKGKKRKKGKKIRLRTT